MTRRLWKGAGRFYTIAWRAICEREGVASKLELSCHWCGVGLDEAPPTLDHVVPVALGGAEWDLDNLVGACRPCNLARGARLGPPPRVAAQSGGTSRHW